MIEQLHLPQPALRKRACACLGSLAVVLAPKQLAYLAANLLKNINPKEPNRAYPFIEALGAVTGTMGYKLSANINAVVAAFRDFCKVKPGLDATSADLDHSIKEVCLTVYENFIRKCPKEVTPHLDEIISMTLELIGYDPNYNPDVAMAEGDEANMEGWGGMEEEQRVEDDSSWKVRRAAVKILDTFVKYRQDKIKPVYERIINKVLERLAEREESIKCSLISAFADMVKGVVVGAPTAVDELESATLLKRKSSAEYLLKDLPAAVSKIVGHYEDKSPKVRETIASLLLNMAFAVPDCMNGVLLGTVLPKLLSNFKENSSSIKIIVLQTLRRLMRTSISADGYIAYLAQILEVIDISIKEDYFKLPAEGLKTAGALVKLLMREQGPVIEEAKKALVSIHRTCNVVFKYTDVDQEIKQAVIYTMGIIAANANGILDAKELDEIIVTLHDRLKYEALRLPIMKAFYTIVTSPRRPAIDRRLESCLPEIIQMARKVVRQVRHTALETLLGICEKYPTVWPKSATSIVSDVIQVLREGDLQLTQLTLKILIIVVGSASDDSLKSLLEAMLGLCNTPLIQAVLEEAIPVFATIARRNRAALTVAGIADALWKSATDKTYKAVATIIANLMVMMGDEALLHAVDSYTATLGNGKAPEQSRKMAAIIIGHIGHTKDLSGQSKLNGLLGELLKVPDEEIKIHAAICMGNIALGNRSYYIPAITSRLKSTQELSYLMLVSIREIIVQDTQGVIKSVVGDILPALRAQADTSDEGDRTIIAEIIGKLLLTQEAVIVPEVEANLESPKENVRATFALSFKYCIQRGKKEMPQFSHLLPKLLTLLRDKSIKVQKALLESLTSVAHLNAMLLRACAAQVLAGAIPMTVLRPELIKTVDLGPLQHKIDDGEPVRKGAYVLIENMLNDLFDKMDLPAIVDRLVDGLGDDSDEVQNACQQILIRVCEISPGSIFAPLDKLLDQIVRAVKKQAEKLRRQQDVDRATDNVRSYLKVLIAMNRLPEIDLNQKFQDCVTDLVKDKAIAGFYDELNRATKV